MLTPSFSSPLFPANFRRDLVASHASNRCQPHARLAIVRGVPASFATGLLAPGINPANVSLALARAQHAAYVETVRATPGVDRVLELAPLDALPDSVFVEDPVVVLSEFRAFMPRAGHPDRVPEGLLLEPALVEAGLEIVRAERVRLDGGDVLKAGAYVFVGLSDRTDAEAVDALRIAFQEDAAASGAATTPIVVSVPVVGGLHLKSIVTWVGRVGSGCGKEGFLIAPDDAHGRRVVRNIEEATGTSWEVVWLEEKDAYAANVLALPGGEEGAARIIMPAEHSEAVLAVTHALEKRCSGAAVIASHMSEFAKANGALTCLSVLV